jgi:hypothetical protein
VVKIPFGLMVKPDGMPELKFFETLGGVHCKFLNFGYQIKNG